MVCEQVSVSPARDAPKVWIAHYLLWFCKKIKMKKKSEKSEIEQNICVLLFKMQKGSQMLDTVALWDEATKSQQQRAGPGTSWFCVCVVTLDTWKWRQSHKSWGRHGWGSSTIIIIKKQQHSTITYTYATPRWLVLREEIPKWTCYLPLFEGGTI